MNQSGWMNRERIAFLFFTALVGWEAWALIMQPPPPLVIPDAQTDSQRPEGRLDEMVRWQRGSVQGQDIFVPAALQQTVETQKAPPKADPIDPDRGKARPPNPIPPVQPTENDVPAPPAPETIATTKPKGPPTEPDYIFPLMVKGVTAPAPGEPLRVIVTSIATEVTFTLQEGDERDGVLVKRITPETIEFINENSRRVFFDTDTLRALADVEEEEEAAAPGPVEILSGLGSSDSKETAGAKNGQPTGTTGLPDIAKLLKGGKLPAGLDMKKIGKMLDGMSPEDIRKRIESLTPAQRKQIEQLRKQFGR